MCSGRLTRDGRTAGCPAGHRYDLARQGYLTLLGGAAPAGAGDTADMVAARAAFLDRGHYAPIVAALAEAVGQVPALHPAGPAPGAPPVPDQAEPQCPDRPRPAGPHAAAPRSADRPQPAGPHPTSAPGSPPLVLDLAGGTGHYLAAALDTQPTAVGLTLELSPYAARRAARAHPRLAAVRTDVWRPLPLATGSCAAVLSVFGPRNAAEIARVLAPEGRLVVVSPAPDHLAEIIEPLGMLSVAPDKSERLSRQLAGFAVVHDQQVHFRAELTRQDVRHEAAMGPSAHHLDPARLEQAVAALPERTPVTIAVSVTTYHAPTHQEAR